MKQELSDMTTETRVYKLEVIRVQSQLLGVTGTGRGEGRPEHRRIHQSAFTLAGVSATLN